jgi:hypothetical protein
MFAHDVEFHVNLQALSPSLDVGETGFAVQPEGQDASGNSYDGALGRKRGGIPAAVLRDDVGYRCRLIETVRIRILAERFNFGELFLALEILVERLERQTCSFPGNSMGSITMGFSERQGTWTPWGSCRGKMAAVGREAVGDAQGTQGWDRTFGVRQDWFARLPEEKDRFFASVHSDLEIAYAILSVSLSDGLRLCQEERLPLAGEQSAMFVALFDRLASRIQTVLRTLGEHGRHCGTFCLVIPLRPGFFRSANAQRLARANHLVSRVLFSMRARFLRKVRALQQVVAELQKDARRVARANPQEMAVSWTRLEVLHYDLNTCFRETMVILKSFLCVLPAQELPPLEGRFLARVTAPFQFFLDDQPRF